MAGEANTVDNWFDQAFNHGGSSSGYDRVQGDGADATQRAVLDLVAGTGVTIDVEDDGASSPPRTKATFTASAGAATIVGPYAAAGPTVVARVAPWMRVKVQASANAVNLKSDPASAEGDQLDFVDVDRVFGTHALTFDGNGHLVEDPFDPDNPPAATYVTPAGSTGVFFSWQLLKGTAGTLFWKVVR